MASGLASGIGAAEATALIVKLRNPPLPMSSEIRTEIAYLRSDMLVLRRDAMNAVVDSS